MKPVESAKFAIAISDDAEKLLGSFLDAFYTKKWTETQAKPICLLCESVDFSGRLIEAKVFAKDGEGSIRIWIPHSYVALAFEFAEARRVGFLS